MKHIIIFISCVVLIGGLWFIGCNKKNSPTNTSSAPNGPSSGIIRDTFAFSTRTTDLDNDDIAYQFLWGNNDTSDWSSFVNSGDSIAMQIFYPSAGTYSVESRAKDINGDISNWSGGHSITISGNVKKWTKTYGGLGDEQGWAVRAASGGGHIITGKTESYGAGQSDVYLINIDLDGNMVWDKTFGGTRSDYGYDVQPTADGGYIITGADWSVVPVTPYNADVYLIKTGADGNVSWTKTFGDTNFGAGFSVQQTSDGGYIIAGQTASYGAGNADIYLIKTNSSGDMVWVKTFGGASWDTGRSVIRTTGGGYIIVGHTMSFGAGGYDMYVVKTDADGNSSFK